MKPFFVTKTNHYFLSERRDLPNPDLPYNPHFYKNNRFTFSSWVIQMMEIRIIMQFLWSSGLILVFPRFSLCTQKYQASR